MDIPSPFRATIRRNLLTWYDRHKRDLPWRRRSRDPYAQMVAELMLQQTRVETVIGYYERFLAQFPTYIKLAKASEDTVLKQWEGLGYYRRAQNLRRAARQVVHQAAGFPTTAAALRRLHGVGEYTAGAIASIAFGERVAAVDGNVSRILARLFGVEEDVLSNNGKQTIWELATQLVPIKRPGDFNQAWMDLGSRVCTPRSPRCTDCPLRRSCLAFSSARTDELPVRIGSRVKRKRIKVLAGVFVDHGRMLVRQRPHGGIWSRLWEFPSVEVDGDHVAGLSSQKNKAAAVRVLRRVARSEGIDLVGKPLTAVSFKHELTHRSLHFTALTVDAKRQNNRRLVAAAKKTDVRDSKQAKKWVSPREFAELAVSTAHRRIFDAVMAERLIAPDPPTAACSRSIGRSAPA